MSALIAPGLRLVDRGLAAVVAAGRWLALPLAVLLFLQWPLREWIHAYSSLANDTAQLLFALYVSIAVTDATRHGGHIAADLLARRYSPSLRMRLARAGALICVVPWAGFVLIAGWSSIAQSVAQLEDFPETYNPGYFIVRASVGLLALLALLQAALDIWRAPNAD